MQTHNILNKFTYHFKKVLINAQNLAYSKKRDFIEPEDLFLSLVKTKGSLGFDILTKQNIDPSFADSVSIVTFQNASIEAELMPQPSEESQKIIEKAVITAYKNQHKYIGTEHLLYGLSHSENDQINKTLAKAKVNIHNLKQHLNLIMKSTSKFSDLASEDEIKEIDQIFDEHGHDQPNTLESFTVNLTNKEVQKDIDPVIGRSREIDRLIEILSRRTKNNPVLLGDAGVGKTAIIEGLAKRITENKVPDVLLNKTILNLDISSLIAGTMYRGEFENRLKQVINDIKSNPNIILFIDELHTIMGAGATNGSLDAANILKPALARGHLRCIGATTFEEYKKHIESDRALERRFQSIVINESSEDETYEILLGIKKNYEKFHKVDIDEEALKNAVVLSNRFLPDKKLPDKAIDLIDEAASRFKVKHTKKSLNKKIKQLTDEIDALQSNKRQAIYNENYTEALDYKKKEDTLLRQLASLKTKEDAMMQTNLGSISSEHIKEIISEMTGVPLSSVTTDEGKKLLDLEKNISKEIFGQEKAIGTISETIRKSKTGLQDKNKPLASFMFLGPSGVGKTYTAKQLARYIFGGEHNMLRIDMSEFSEKFNISKLIGAPAGYVGYKEGNKLTDRIKNKPYTLILFDEIEKAHKEVFNLLLPILEEGELTDATGRTVNFRNTIIVMTSNVGLEKFNQEASLGFDIESKAEKDKNFKNTSQKITKNLNKYFPPEFINRLDNIIAFESLDKKSARRIIKKEIGSVAERLFEQEIYIEFDGKVVNYLLKTKDPVKEGARSLKRIVDQKLTNPIASYLLQNSDTKKLQIVVEKNKIAIK